MSSLLTRRKHAHECVFLGGNTDVNLLPLELKQVSFDGDKYWQLKSDDAKVDYAAPQWVDNNGNNNATDLGEHNYAVAFTRNTNPKIGAKFNITGAVNLGAITIRAAGSDGIAIPETLAQVNGDTVWIDPTPSNVSLPDTVKFYDKKNDATAFKLDWELKIGETWIKAATTKHTVYVTLGDPPATTFRQETVFEIGCRTADKLDDGNRVSEKIWGEFAGLHIVRVLDGQQLTYYKDYFPPATTAPELLESTDGDCNSWATLFMSVRKAQGLDDNYMYAFQNRIPRPETDDDLEVSYGFFIKTWIFAGTGSSGNVKFPYLNVASFGANVGEDRDAWKYAEVNYSGINAQGNKKPHSLFVGHTVVRIGGMLYDPSYGRKYESIQNLDDLGLAGYYRAKYREGNGTEEAVYMMSKNPGGGVLEVTFDIKY